MPDHPGRPAMRQAPPGKITRIAVTYTVNTDAGPRHTFHGLIGMEQYVQPGRLRKLLDDLTVVCEELLEHRPQPVTGLPDTVTRIPFGPSLVTPDPAAQGSRAACRELLAAVRDALDCPPPADDVDVSAFLRVRSDRARMALAAILPVLADVQSGPAQMTGAARQLLDDVAACPADGYARSSLSS